MARQKRLKKPKVPGFVDDMKGQMVRTGVTVLVALIFLLAAAALAKAFLYGSDYFRLRTAETKATFLDRRIVAMINSQVLNQYKGRNVFRIDLPRIANSIQGSYADVKDVVVRVALPDKLVVSLKMRRPVALVHNVKYYPIDEEGIVLPGMIRPDLFRDLPVIEGIDMRSGVRRDSARNLKRALSLLEEIRQERVMADFPVMRIDAADPRNLSVFLKNGIEVRVGCENFDARIALLGKTLKDPRLVMDKIRYIDVRFKDIAIGPK